MKKIFKFGCGSMVALLALIIVIAMFSGEESSTDTAKETTNTDTENEQTNTESSANQVVEEPEEDSVPREYKSALEKAKTYAEIMHMSKAGIYDQLTSEYGEKFPAEAAQYAIDNINHDWKANALEKAKTYAETMAMSDSAIYDQLISEHGEKFTPEEAQYAIDNLK